MKELRNLSPEALCIEEKLHPRSMIFKAKYSAQSSDFAHPFSSTQLTASAKMWDEESTFDKGTGLRIGRCPF